MRGRKIAEDRTKHVVCGQEAEIEEYLCTISISSAARTQDQLDEMFNEIIPIFSKYNFSIAMTGENEEMMRLQGRLMFKELYNMIDTMYAAKTGSE